MADQKIENLLELSLDTPVEIREKSENLSVGYDSAEKTWEVILRYSGDVEKLRENYGKITPLFGGYAIAVVPESRLQALAGEPEVEYIEKPKALSFAVYEGKMASCIPPVQRAPFSLSGKNILVAVVDSGIDIYHPDFCNEDGTTRIVGLWDQTVETGNPPEGYDRGTYFSQEQINEYLKSQVKFPSGDISGHGTHVTGIAAGNGRASDGEWRGVAYESDILVVKLQGQKENGFPQTAALMEGVDFCVKTALSRSQPLALNLSYGNNYGSHDGTSLLESYLDTVAAIGRTTICIGSGNEGNKARHSAFRLVQGQEYRVEFTVAPGEYSLGLQLWKNYSDRFGVRLESPGGSSAVISENAPGSYRYVLDGTEVLVYMGEPSPYHVAQEIYMELVPYGIETNVSSGVWKLSLYPEKIVEGSVNLWLPSGSSINSDTGFLVPSLNSTLTIPSTAYRPITVGAYNSNTGSFAAFSGRGAFCGEEPCYSLGYDFVVKPDLAAPGVDIVSCSPGGGYTARTGTSMACPFVTGSAALLMQYGIVNGQDSYLYGQKVKAYLERGAKPLKAFSYYPNSSVGAYGNIVSS
jgi:subtilisin family serine protease